MTSILIEALDYARRGWYVFPCREKPGQPYVRNGETFTPAEKTPYTSGGLNDATVDEEQITAWWSKWQNALIGVNAGKSGLFVVDIDKKHVNGLDTFTSWNINDTAGLHSITPSGGMHIVFSGTGKSSTNAKTGIDTRGEGGYFIAPPSRIVEGEYAGEYKAFDDWNRQPGVIPDGLMIKLFPDKTVEYVRGNLGDGERKQLSRASLNFLANGAPEGERNTTLFRVLADFAGCGYTKEQAKETVLPAALRSGLKNSEFETVLIHAYSKPRSASIPDSIQQKILEGGKDITKKITAEEQAVIESALLSCMILNNSLIPVIQDILNYEDFQLLKNRLIYRAITQMYGYGMKVDAYTVKEEVSKETDKITLDDIERLTNDFYTNSEHALTYASIIKEKASIRKIEALMDNKEKYIKIGNIVNIVSELEKDISDIAVYGGAKSTNVLSGEQATTMVAEHTRKIISGEIQQLKTGFSQYDYEIGGFYSNELIMCAGRAGEGKSALALSILNHVALVEKKPVLMFSLEMSTHESICRLICQLTGLPFKNVYQGKLKAKEWELYDEAMEKISNSPMYFDDSFGITLPELRSKIRKMMEKDIKLIVIDQLEQIRGFEGMAEHIRLDKIAYELKSFTQEFDVPILVNHQMNRSITDRKLKNPEPQLSDLNQAGEKSPNQVWVICHRKDDKGNIIQSKVKVLKNRNGARIDFAVIFVGERMLFSNPTTEEEKRVFYSKDYNGDDGGSGGYDGDEPSWARNDDGTWKNQQ